MSELGDNTAEIVGHVKEALWRHTQGGSYRVGTAAWAVASQRVKGRLTGAVIAVCPDLSTVRSAAATHLLY